MNIHLEHISKTDFDFAKGTVFNQEEVASMVSNGHNSVDNCHIPSWATKVQDVFEQKAVVYDEREIAEQDFLGVKLIVNEEKVIVSIGRMGEPLSLAYVMFETVKNENGTLTLGDALIQSFVSDKQAS